jgi:hypothetical protein
MLDFIEHSLDQIALFTKVFVKISGFFAIGSGRTDNLGPHNFCRITSLVCQDSLDFQPLQKHQSLCVIQHLTPCQNESNRLTKRIANRMDLPGKPTAKAPE